jgi:hypothetical protein
MLVFHIGLPKTASTYLQNGIFREANGLDLIHRKSGRRAKEICSAIRYFNSPNPVRYRLAAMAVRRMLRSYEPEHRVVVVASENISISRTTFWTGQAVGPELVARRLSRLRKKLGRIAEPTRVVIGIRRQDHWLASRYAGSSESFSHFSQSDFEQRLRSISDSAELRDPITWLDYTGMRDAFLRHFSNQELFFVPMEQLGDASGSIMQDLGRFMGGVDLLTPYSKSHAPGGQAQRNVHGTEANTWPLRNGAGTIELTPELSERILHRFRESNEQLRELLGVDYTG